MYNYDYLGKVLKEYKASIFQVSEPEISNPPYEAFRRCTCTAINSNTFYSLVMYQPLALNSCYAIRYRQVALANSHR